MQDLEIKLVQASTVAADLPFAQWFFGEALAFDGVASAAAYLQDDSLWATLRHMLRGWREKVESLGISPEDLDAPVRSAVVLADHDGTDGTLLKASVGVCTLIDSSPKHEGALLHPLKGYPNDMVFVDCLYYVGPHLATVAAHQRDLNLFDQAAAQTLAHIELLKTPDGLFDHIYNPATASTNGIAWGRGNGWAILGIVDTLELLPVDHDGYEPILNAFTNLARASRNLQDPLGHWHTILDDPESPLEPSIAAFLAAALFKGMRLGLLDDSYSSTAQLAWKATISSLDMDSGSFVTSMTEWPVGERQAYYSRPSGVNPWGQGSFLRAAVEYLRSAH